VILLVFATASGAKPQNKAKVYLQTKKASLKDSLSNPQRGFGLFTKSQSMQSGTNFCRKYRKLEKGTCQ